MGTESYVAWVEWMECAENHIYSLFDIWEAGRDYQREKDAQLVYESDYEGYYELSQQIRNDK